MATKRPAEDPVESSDPFKKPKSDEAAAAQATAQVVDALLAEPKPATNEDSSGEVGVQQDELTTDKLPPTEAAVPADAPVLADSPMEGVSADKTATLLEATAAPPAAEEPVVEKPGEGDVLDAAAKEADAKAEGKGDGDVVANGDVEMQKQAAEPQADAKPASDNQTDNEEDQPVTLGYRTFESGHDCKRYYNKLLAGISLDQNLNEYEHNMVSELLMKGHPDPSKKIGQGILAFQVREVNLSGSTTRCFYVIRTDDSSEDFSTRKCIGNLFPHFSKNDGRAGEGGGGASGSRSGGGRGRGGRGRGRRGRGRRGGRN